MRASVGELLDAVGVSSNLSTLHTKAAAMQPIIDSLAREPELLIPIILGGLGILAGICIPIAIQWRIVRVTEENNLLKQALLERGLTPEEVALVLNAGSRSRSHRRVHLEWQKPDAAAQRKHGCGAC